MRSTVASVLMALSAACASDGSGSDDIAEGAESSEDPLAMLPSDSDVPPAQTEPSGAAGSFSAPATDGDVAEESSEAGSPPSPGDDGSVAEPAPDAEPVPTSDEPGAPTDASAAAEPDASLEAEPDAPVIDAGSSQQAVSCDTRELVCRRAEPPCPEGQVSEIVDGCYGECVPINECVCTTPEACPHPETFVCIRSTQRCSYYLR